MIDKVQEVRTRGIDRFLGVTAVATIVLYSFGALTVTHVDGIALILLTLIGVVSALFGFERRRFLPKTLWYIGVAAALMVAIAVVASVAADSPPEGFRMLGRLGRWLLFIPAAAAVWAARRIIKPDKFGWIFLSGAAIAALYGIVQSLVLHRQATGTSGVSIDYGTILAIQSFVGLMLIQGKTKSEGKEIALWLLYAVSLAGVIFSGSRGAVGVAFVLSVWGIYWVAHESWKVNQRLRRTFLVASGVGIIVASPFLVSSIVRVRFLRDWQQITALHWPTVPRVSASPASLLLCPNTGSILHSLADRVVTGGSSLGNIIVVRSTRESWSEYPWLKCIGNSYLKISNDSKKNTYRVHIPDAVRLDSNIPALILVKGSALFSLGAKVSGVSVNSSEWRLVKVPFQGEQDGYLTVVVKPGNDVWIIPTQIVPGQFIFPRDSGTVEKRLWMWRGAFLMLFSRPLIGYGLGGYREQAMTLSSEGQIPVYLGGTHAHPHNDLLWAASWGGVWGSIAYVILLLSMVFACRYGRSAATINYKLYPSIGGGIAFGIFLGGLTEALFVHALFNSSLIIVLATVVSLAAADTGSFGENLYVKRNGK